MKKGDVMWKCPNCGRIIPDPLYMMRKNYGQCPCGEWYWELDKFIIDKDDKININIELLIEKAYRNGYSRGYEEGKDREYSEGFGDGYKAWKNNSST